MEGSHALSPYTHPSMPGTSYRQHLDPILEIPAHIAALPENEQGPALVRAIHERKLGA